MSERPRSVLAADLGGSRLKLAVVSDQGDLTHQRVVPTDADRPGLLDRLTEALAALREQATAEPLAVGLATAGIVDGQGTIIGGGTNLPGWRGTPVGRLLSERLGLSVAVDNDVNCAALGEHWQGAGGGSPLLLAVMVGTGIGAGLVVDGRLYRGAHHGGMDISYEAIPEAPFGYFPNPHAAECAIGLTALRLHVSAALAANRQSLLPHDESWSPTDLFAAAEAGDLVAEPLIARWHTALTTLLANLVNLLDPDRVVIGGGLIEAAGGTRLTHYLTREVGRRLTPERRCHLDLRLMTCGENAGLLGAARLALTRAGA